MARRAALAALLAAAAAGCGEAPAPPPPAPKEAMDEPVELTLGLQPGDVLPPLVAAGWVNGPPPKPGDPGQKLLVVDVWGMWCPFCQSNAPGMLRLHQKYAPRGVQFVALTNTPKGGIEAYCERNKLPWANGYDMPPGAVAALGAGSGMKQAGYQVAPTIYLVTPDGKIVWTDGRARMNHQDQAVWAKNLDDAIAAALGPPVTP